MKGPENQTYTVMVEHWGGGDPGSDGEVIFNVGTRTFLASKQNLAPRFVWLAGTIAWPSGEVRTSTLTYDCTGSWSSGCTMDLP